MKRPETHQIDTDAQEILKNLLPKPWNCSKYESDYGKDFIIEVVEDDRTLTGMEAVLQLKGTRLIRKLKHKPTISFSLTKDHIEYYSQKMRYPVFLVVIDVTDGVGWWLFLQEYLHKNPIKFGPRASATLAIPRENNLSDSKMLRVAIENAISYMAAKDPSAMSKSVEFEKKRLESLDPRFTVKVTSDSDGTIKKFFMPKETVPIAIEFKGPADKINELTQNAIMKGLKANLEGINVSLTGSEIFSNIVEKPISFRAEQRIPLTVCVDVSATEPSEPIRIQFAGIAKGGTHQLTFDSYLDASPLHLNIIFNKTNANVFGKPSPSLSLNIHKWIGMRIQTLPHFNTIIQLFRIILLENAPIKFTIESQGNRIFAGRTRAPSNLDKEIISVLNFMDVIRKILFISKVDCLFQLPIAEHEIDQIITMWTYVQSPKITRSYSNAQFSVDLTPSDAEKFFAPSNVDNQSQTFELKGTFPEISFTFFKYKFTIHDFEFTTTKTKLVTTREEVLSARGESTSIIFTTGEGGTILTNFRELTTTPVV